MLVPEDVVVLVIWVGSGCVGNGGSVGTADVGTVCSLHLSVPEKNGDFRFCSSKLSRASWKVVILVGVVVTGLSCE